MPSKSPSPPPVVTVPTSDGGGVTVDVRFMRAPPRLSRTMTPHTLASRSHACEVGDPTTSAAAAATACGLKENVADLMRASGGREKEGGGEEEGGGEGQGDKGAGGDPRLRRSGQESIEKRRGSVVAHKKDCIESLHNCIIAQLHHCTTASLLHCITAQLHHCTTASLHNCTTAQLHHCSTAAQDNSASTSQHGTGTAKKSPSITAARERRAHL